jgi:hypothetical protein
MKCAQTLQAVAGKRHGKALTPQLATKGVADGLFVVHN